MRVEAFGGLAVVDSDGGLLSAGGGLQGAAFAVLCVTPGEPVSLGVFAGALWGDTPPDRYARSLATYMSNLRRQLGVGIESSSGGYRLGLGRAQVTTTLFADSVGDAGGDVCVLRSALALWVGEPFAGLEGHGVFRDEQIRLAELRLVTVRRVARDDIDAGRSDDAVRWLLDLVDVFPYDEQLRGLLMEALYRTGRQAEAIRSFASFRLRLVDELGIEPSADLRDLELAILNQDLPTPDTADTKPPSSDPRDLEGRVLSADPADPVTVECVTNLPSPASTFVGRDAEIGELVELCSQHRMVTVAGIGGIGKTRLAVEVARACLDSFDDGAFLVDLVGVSDPDAVGRRFLSVLGIAERPDEPAVETLTELLGDSRQLLVVDNCEHVVAGVADTLGRLLPACPGVHVLATSRIRVGVDGEELWELAGLRDSDAAQLLADRAHSVNRDFSLTTESREAVAGVCRTLDGIPLAIELAAARIRVMTIGEITERLTDRFAFLSDARTAGPDRHRTLRSMIDWSYDLLTQSDQQLFRLLGVFRAGFNLDAVEAMRTGPDTNAAEAVEHLVDASLVTVDTTGRTTRYRLLETVREYAMQRLEENGETSAGRNRHLAHFACLGEAAYRGMGHGFNEVPVTSEEEEFWIAAVELDLANLRHALDWALEVGELDDALTVATPLSFYLIIEVRFTEVIELLTSVLDREDCPATPLWCDALCRRALCLANIGDHRAEAAADEAEQAVRRLNLRAGYRVLSVVRAQLAEIRGDIIGALAHFEEALARDEAAKDPRIAGSFYEVGEKALLIGEIDRAVDLAERLAAEGGDEPWLPLILRSSIAAYQRRHQDALDLARDPLAASDRWYQRRADRYASYALFNLGHLDEARNIAATREPLFRRFGPTDLLERTLILLGLTALRSGDIENSRIRLRETVNSARQRRDPFMLWTTFHAVAEYFAKTGDTDTTAVLLSHCIAVTEHRRYAPQALNCAPLVTLDTLAKRIDPDRFVTLVTAGRTATTDDLATELLQKLTT